MAETSECARALTLENDYPLPVASVSADADLAVPHYWCAVDL